MLTNVYILSVHPNIEVHVATIARKPTCHCKNRMVV